MELDMSKNEIGHKGASSFGEALKINFNLQRLSLSNCELGPKGL